MKQKSTRNVTVRTVKKSIAAIALAWFFRNARHVGEGGFRPRIMYLATVDSATVQPNSIHGPAR
jgi:hypothetical protein